MNHPLQKNLFLIKEHIGLFKAANNFDIYNPESAEHIFNCREENLGGFTKFFRFTKYKIMTPIAVEIKTVAGEPILSIKRGFSFFGFKPLLVYDEKGALVGTLNRRIRIAGAKIEINDKNNQPLFLLKGNFIGWDFKIYKNDQIIAQITKKWAGLGKELFTSADNYILQIENNVEPNDTGRVLLLAAVLCIDFLLKEN
ncbi:MAG: LURP-one-related family protein [Flavobacteriales bacterium]